MSDCSNIKDINECEKKDNCIWNKSKKCQKKPSKRITKKNNQNNSNKFDITYLENNNVYKESISTVSNDSHVDVDSIITDKDEISNPCEMRDEITYKIEILQKEKQKYVALCNQQLTELDTKTTYIQLLQYLFKYNVTDYDDFFGQFPSSAGGKRLINNIVFEGLWKLVFLLKLDNLDIDYTRHFKLKLNISEQVTPYKYLNEHVNSGNKTGICDLIFEVDKTGQNESILNACEQSENIIKPSTYLCTSKYKKKETGNLDIGDIDTQARQMGIKSYNIVTLVKNKDARCNKTTCYEKFDPKLTFGEEELRKIYFKKIIKWLHDNFDNNNINDIEHWKEILKDITGKYKMTLLFHQDYVVQYTQNILGNKTNGKFIWGAVARSGKTFMAGGLISLRQPKVVILLLGAINETKDQFLKELFNKYADFKDYNIVDTQKKYSSNFDKEKKYIIAISQEKIRQSVKMEKGKNKGEDKKLMNFLNEALMEKDKIIFFDEIHQGGSEGSMQLNTLEYFYQDKFPEPILIMITATYGKPYNKYNIDLGKNKEPTVLITWSYEMIQKMKQFNIDMVDIQSEYKDKLISIDDDNYEEKMKLLKDMITNKYEVESLIEEYKNYPNLVYLLPELDMNSYIDKDDINNDSDNAVISQNKNISNLFELNKNGFKYPNSMNKLLSSIYDNIYEKKLHDIYGYVANGEKFHTQLWFLPTQLKKSINSNKEKDDSSFETVSRLLAENIISNNKFRNFNVCIIHSLNANKTDSTPNEYGQKIFYTCIKDKNVKDCIKQKEILSKQENKSLIILTGKRLRLGISLPCVDVAIHMDGIKSYDIIYQSMFRVLTPRKGKTHGFFIDMILDRAVSFCYDYTIRSKETGDNNKPRISMEDVINTLRLFDLNGINYKDNQTLQNYHKELLELFKLNDEYSFKNKLSEFYIFYSEKQLSQKLIQIYNNKDTEFIRQIREIGISGDKNKEKIFISILETNKFQTTNNNNNNNDDDDDDNDDDSVVADNNDNNNIINDDILDVNSIESLSKLISHIFAIYILFSSDNPNNKVITEVDNIFKNYDTLDYEAIETCKDEHIMFYCYFIKNFQLHSSSDIYKVFNILMKSNNLTLDNKDNKKIKEWFKNNAHNFKRYKKDIDIFTQIIKSRLNNDSDIKIPDDLDESLQMFLKQKNTTEDMKYIIDAHMRIIQTELINLYSNIKENLNISMLKEKLKKEQSFFDNSPNFCPESFLENEKVIEIVRKYLDPKESEKKLFGEVFTPINVVCDMLDKLPENIWKDENKKWLDPAAGIGNYPIIVYYKLMEKLDSVPINKRSNHIIEKMLYMVELNSINVAVCKKIFKMIDPNSKPNISCSSFLEKKDINDPAPVWKNDFKLDKFDIIMGNPPYNKGGTGKGGGVFWKEFVFQSFSNALNDNGYLLFIHPPGWRKPKGEKASGGDVWELFRNYNLIFLKISDKKIPNFPKVDYYVVQKTKEQKDTFIINEFENQPTLTGKINLYKLDFIPHFINPDVLFILNKILNKSSDKFSIIRDQTFKPNEKDKQTKSGIPHASYYDVNKKDYLPIYKTYETVPDYINKPKIVMTYSNGKQKGLLYPKYYSDVFGTTANTMYQLIENGDKQKNFVKLFNSDIIKFLLKITQYSEPPNYKNEFKILNKISKPNDVIFDSENDIYNYYGLNEKEIKLIKDILNKDEQNTKVRKTISKGGKRIFINKRTRKNYK